ncbi:hypothetical protein AB0D42_35555 [Streptomyces sp. NPDC048304]
MPPGVESDGLIREESRRLGGRRRPSSAPWAATVACLYVGFENAHFQF